MPYVDKPRSDERRSTCLRLVSETSAADHQEGKEYIPQSLLTEVTGLVPIFGAAFSKVDMAMAGRVKETTERREILGKLQTYVRDYWQGLLRRTARENHSVEVLRMHGLPAEGSLPNPTRNQEWIVWAERVVAGDAAAVGSEEEPGLPPMCNPTSAQVQAVMEQAKAESADVSEADRALDDAQAALAELRGQADDLIDQAVMFLQLNLRKLDPPSRRRIMRTYGVVFKAYEGEVETASE